MRYKNQDDNRYRVNFMRSTEMLMDSLKIKEFIAYLELVAELEDDEDYEYLEGKVVKCKAYNLREENSNLHKEFLVTEDGRVFYWRSLNSLIELVDREEVNPEKIKAKMIIVFSRIMKGYATKEEVIEEILELLATEKDPYKVLRDNIERWASDYRYEDVLMRIVKCERYLRR